MHVPVNSTIIMIIITIIIIIKVHWYVRKLPVIVVPEARWLPLTVIRNMAWERLECSFMFVNAVDLFFLPIANN